MDGGGLAFAQPLWLLLLPLPWIQALLARRAGAGRGARAYAEPHLLPWLSSGAPRRAALASGAILLAWLLGVVAASGPYLRAGQPAGATPRALDIAVVVDISPSMGVADIAPNRLARAKLELRDFLAALEADRTALVLYAADAYPVLPLTRDREVPAHYIAALDPGLAKRRGSNLAPALETAARLLAPARAGARAIVLVSDGEAHDDGARLAAATRSLAGQRIPVFALGIGTAAGGPVPDDAGRLLRGAQGVIVSRLDRVTLERIATASGGAYIELRDDDGDWRAVFANLDALARSGSAGGGAARGVPLFPWLLSASLALFIATGARRAALAALATMTLILGGPPPPAGAAPWTEQRAYDAFSDGDYTAAAAAYRAIDTFNGQLGLGASAYRGGAWAEALTAFERAFEHAASDDERARAVYNSGNALAHLGRLAEAGRAYERALALRPNYPHAALNLGLVAQEQLRLAGERSTVDPRAEQRPGSDGVPDDAAPGDAGAGPQSGGAENARAARAPAAGRDLAHRRAIADNTAAVLSLRLDAQDRNRPSAAQTRPW